MKITLALLMAAAISTLGFQEADAQNYNGWMSGSNPYFNAGTGAGFGNGGNCGINGNRAWRQGRGNQRISRAKQIRKMQRKMARRAMQNQAAFNNQYGYNNQLGQAGYNPYLNLNNAGYNNFGNNGGFLNNLTNGVYGNVGSNSGFLNNLLQTAGGQFGF